MAGSGIIALHANPPYFVDRARLHQHFVARAQQVISQLRMLGELLIAAPDHKVKLMLIPDCRVEVLNKTSQLFGLFRRVAVQYLLQGVIIVE